MKKMILLLMPLMALVACNNNSYSKQLKAEKKLIESYIARNELHIIDKLPADGEAWGEKDYYQVPGIGSDYYYFHLSKPGLTDRDSIIAGEHIVLRYKRMTLDEYPVVDSYWTTNDGPDAIRFDYLTDQTNACSGWHAAVRMCKYPESECIIICPSKLGFNAEQSSVTPYVYQMNVRVHRY